MPSSAFLEVRSSNQRAYTFPIEGGRLRVGRGAEVDLVLDDPLLSKTHALIEVRGDGYVLIDEGSRNGTFVGGKRAKHGTEIALEHGETITLGLTTLVFNLGDIGDHAPPVRRVIRTTDDYFSVHDLLGNVKAVSLPAPILKLLVSLAEEVLPETEPSRLHQAALRIAMHVLGASAAAVLVKGRNEDLVVAAQTPEDAKLDFAEQRLYQAVLERRGVVLRRGEPSVLALPLFSPKGVSAVLYAVKDTFDDEAATFGAVIAAVVGPSLALAYRVKSVFAEREEMLSRLRARAGDHPGAAALVGDSAAIVRLREHIGAAARHARPTLVTGELGTGKEAIARAIHTESARGERGFVSVSGSALASEDALFGAQSGERPSLYDLAAGGTLFIDSIEELPASVQLALGRVLLKEPDESSPRIIAGSLLPLVALREKLDQALGAAFATTVLAPPLRERREDIAAMAQVFLRQHGGVMGKTATLSSNALKALERADHAANLRSLSHAIERALFLVHQGQTIAEELVEVQAPLAEGDSLKDVVNAFERQYILRVLREQRGHRTRTAKQLGLSRQSLGEKLTKHGIEDLPGD